MDGAMTITEGANSALTSSYVPYPYTGGCGTSISYITPTYTEPITCIGKAHVFECEHVATCKCGAIKRIMPKPKKAKS